MRAIKITDHIHYVGTNDRKKHLFENNWPLPNGVSYNSYLIADK
ncbi:MAG: FprA family A-type flavoprotein, partial [Bacteroidales bacterium]